MIVRNRLIRNQLKEIHKHLINLNDCLNVYINPKSVKRTTIVTEYDRDNDEISRNENFTIEKNYNDKEMGIVVLLDYIIGEIEDLLSLPDPYNGTLYSDNESTIFILNDIVRLINNIPRCGNLTYSPKYQRWTIMYDGKNKEFANVEELYKWIEKNG